ncbi:lipopolysaccharide biosynthesis protein [Sulfurimonas autotrophica]|uniref:Lipopolysaccharide biosynthesis protein n=1 Tax=Sulfurimonas autotrophica (strain ATCC BAA-671 / DSM 16294 / JCM 11897 / OK10) TaxID=563040 RepID=E0UU23_SULAO|nr:lipopolysaccharide biosynthesis protein [Sulfurimonas autotrophica]ADN08332.1 Lipopolysaccharide biosynthesis protein [Sulfurimonas autotrophica DSM 16294]
MIKKLKQIKWYKAIKKSDLFDIKYYLFTYTDIRAMDIDPIWHYIKYGADEGRNPSDKFDTSFYLSTYNDVKEKGVNPLAHYILHGKNEGRKTSKSNYSNKSSDAVSIPKYKYVKVNNALKNDSVCIFAHYDKDNIIDDYVVNYIKELKKIDIDIIFVTVCEDMKMNELEKLNQYVSINIVRENIGYDFASWKIGLDYIIENSINCKTLILANDSVYGPLYNLKTIFNSMQKKNYDIWGLTDNFYSSYHLQSYFLVFNQQAIKSNIFIDFFKEMKVIEDKAQLIEAYEIGLSKLLAKHFKLGSYIAVQDVCTTLLKQNLSLPAGLKASIANYTINVTHIGWKELIEKFKFPFIKVELLRDNPIKMNNLDYIKILAKKDDYIYDFNLISSHLKKVEKKTNKISGYNIINRATKKSERKTICALGSARGGTSMVSGLLRIMGVNMGDDLDPDTNEDKDFLHASNPIEDIYNIHSEGHEKVKKKLINLINKKNEQYKVWGWKDPQGMMYFDKIDSFLREPYCIIIYRDPLAITQKEINDGIHKDIISTLEFVVNHRFKELVNVTKFIQQKNYPLLLISYERSLRDKENLIQTLADFLNLELSQEVVDKCKDYVKADRNTGLINI